MVSRISRISRLRSLPNSIERGASAKSGWQSPGASAPTPLSSVVTGCSSSIGNAPAQCHDRNLRRHAESDRDDGAAETRGNDEVAAVLDDVAVGETLPVGGGHDRPADEGKIDLPSVRVAAQGDGEAVGNVDKEVR